MDGSDCRGTGFCSVSSLGLQRDVGDDLMPGKPGAELVDAEEG